MQRPNRNRNRNDRFGRRQGGQRRQGQQGQHPQHQNRQGGNRSGGGQGRGHGQGQGQGQGDRQPASHPHIVTTGVSHNGHVEGILQVEGERGDGQLRDPLHPLRPAKGNVLVPRQLIRELQLRPGLLLRGTPSGRMLNRIDTIEGRPPDEYVEKTALYDATALDPQPVLKLEHSPTELTTRVIDILAPVGFGQRGLIVAPPRTGKTILLQNIARGVHANYPHVQLVLLLIDERPEEVTDMKRNVPGTVYASSNDNTVEKHLDLAQLVIERCKRQVEFGADIVVLMDSLTRVGRAFNTGGQQGGRTMSGGLDNRALEIPKRLFGAARKIEHGGSLTILATCLIDTGSRMDQVIFEEFKGTGNMELTLDRNLSNQRIFPALNIAESGTRKEELLLDAKHLGAIRRIRRHLIGMSPVAGMKSLLEALPKHKNNESLLNSMQA